MSDLRNFKIKDGVLKKYVGTDGNVVIPDGVTYIGKRAFAEMRHVETVTIPQGVTGIGESAFCCCWKLRQVSFPKTLERIEPYAFRDCEMLESVKLYNKVAYIGAGVFINCERLKKVTIPVNLSSIAQYTFAWCRSLERITLPDKLTDIGDDAFFGCSGLKTVTIPDRVTTIGRAAFANCKRLTSVKLPDGLKRIGREAFSRCQSLSSVTLPDSVTDVGKDAFSRTNLIWTGRRIPAQGDDRSLRDECLVLVRNPAAVGLVLHPLFLGDPNTLLPAQKRKTILTFLEAVRRGYPEVEPYRADYISYLRDHADAYVRLAFEDEFFFHFFLEEKLVFENRIRPLLSWTENNHRPELTAALLAYQQETFAQRKQDLFSLSDNDPELKRRMKMEKRREEIKDRKGIRGLAFAVTGPLLVWKTHRGLQAFIEAKGGVLRSTVSSQTDYLICNDPNINLEKARRAKELGVTVINEKDLFLMGLED